MKYIDAEKLIANLERQNVDKKVIEPVIRIIDSLQQEQPIDIINLTWRDVNDLERIINNVHYEFRNGIGEDSFGKLVLERFIDGKDDSQEHQEVDLEKEIEDYWIATEWSKVITLGKFKVIARYFYGLGQLNSK